MLNWNLIKISIDLIRFVLFLKLLNRNFKELEINFMLLITDSK